MRLASLERDLRNAITVPNAQCFVVLVETRGRSCTILKTRLATDKSFYYRIRFRLVIVAAVVA
jgi:hypothetical protein